MPGRSGTKKVSESVWDGIVGVKGRYAFGDDRKWFVPFYLDVGTGQTKLTWQAAAGVGYAFHWGDVVGHVAVSRLEREVGEVHRGHEPQRPDDRSDVPLVSARDGAIVRIGPRVQARTVNGSIRFLPAAFAALLATPLARSFRSVRERGDAILHTLHLVVLLFCWTMGVLVFTLAHSALNDLVRVATVVANASVSAGDMTITFSAVLAALMVVVVTWLVTKVVRFILDHEILPRLNLRMGVPIAISTIVGYVLVVTGFVLAMAALGIDLTKVTLLAGAVGVGVGLGLQNVVNNFASGLILMLERPINVGDQIDVGGVVGEVKRIGVRSSTIRTSQGAEVIVPNADLASKQVTNWTLSDRARRYEIDVGVAYGSDPARVLKLLEGAAADLPEVQKVPPPRALFSGFGDSSLDFRLYAWVESVDIGMQAQNSLRMAVLRALDEAGIEIPFPQRDLHIRYAPDGAGPAAVLKT